MKEGKGRKIRYREKEIDRVNGEKGEKRERKREKERRREITASLKR